jgi:hypothetical protein
MRDRHGVPLSRREMLALCVGFGTAPMVLDLNRPASAQPAASPLLTRPIPRSGEVLPAVGLGTANGWDSGNDPAEQAARTAVIRALVEAGGKLIDTAPSYGGAEDLVGDIVTAAGSRRAVFLATKLESYDRRTGPEELQASLRRLRTGQIDLMQLHNVSDPHQDLAMLRRRTGATSALPKRSCGAKSPTSSRSIIPLRIVRHRSG